MSENIGETQNLGMTTTLKASKDTIRGIFIIEAAPPFHFLEGDNDFCTLTGYTNQADFGREFSTMIHPEDYDYLKQNIQEQLRLSNHTHHRFRLQCADGSYLSVRTQGDFFQLKDGRQILKCSITDSTELDSIALENLRAKSDLEIFARTIHDGLSKHLCDHQLSLLWCNDYFYMLGGYTKAEWDKEYGSNTLGIIYQKDLAPLISKIADITENTAAEMDFRIRCKDGSIKWLHAAAGYSGEIQDNFRVINVILSDISPLMTAERNARIATEQYMILSDISEEIAYEYSFSSDTLTMSRQYKRYFDFPQIIKNPRKQLGDTDYISEDTREIFRDILNKMLRGAPKDSAEFKIRDKQGNYAWFYTTFSSIIDDNGHLIKMVGLLKNIDVQKQSQEALLKKAQLDNATGLYNKGTTEHFIQKSLSCLNAGQSDALMLIDIDDFKQVNDTFGHLAGDEVIVSIAKAMQGIITQNDMAGRIGGDEFAIYFTDVLDTDMLMEKAESIADTLRRQYPGAAGQESKHFDGSEQAPTAPKVTLSIGIATAVSGTTYESLLNDADTALYTAKLKGKNCTVFYNEAMERAQYSNPRREFEEMKSPFMSLTQSIVETLDRSHSTEVAIQQALTYAGTNLPVDKIGIFEYTKDRKYLNCTYQWNKNPVDSTLELEQHIPASPFEELSKISTNGIFYCPDTSMLHMVNPDDVPDPSYRCQLGTMKITEGNRVMGYISVASTDINKKWS
ncbi:MAG: diguanylate cyclase, partial [Lachnospiraceae bacterium]|nr:diguanylate cyclase [Lachnospiraceae bacterium]